jgi:hypothetical protein
MHYGMQGPLVFQRPRVGQGFPYLCVNAWPEKPKIPEGKSMRVLLSCCANDLHECGHRYGVRKTLDLKEVRENEEESKV